MPRLPRVSGAEAIRALEKLGFIKLGHSGSHVILRTLDKGWVVPVHDELRVGTLAGVLRQADVTAEAFVAALR